MTHWGEMVTYERVTYERVTHWGERVTYKRVTYERVTRGDSLE